jgi:hypothetical protein
VVDQFVKELTIAAVLAGPDEDVALLDVAGGVDGHQRLEGHR